MRFIFIFLLSFPVFNSFTLIDKTHTFDELEEEGITPLQPAPLFFERDNEEEQTGPQRREEELPSIVFPLNTQNQTTRLTWTAQGRVLSETIEREMPATFLRIITPSNLDLNLTQEDLTLNESARNYSSISLTGNKITFSNTYFYWTDTFKIEAMNTENSSITRIEIDSSSTASGIKSCILNGTIDFQNLPESTFSFYNASISIFTPPQELLQLLERPQLPQPFQ